MVEKMTAVWLILLTILVCAAVPGLLIWMASAPATSAPATSAPATSAPARMLLGLDVVGDLQTYQLPQ
jgi:uncharacterized iron-regulated membrane protein